MLNIKMRNGMDEIAGEVAEREDLIEAIAIALLTRKNLFVLGDTGQAKSHVINLFRERIAGARQFERLLSKQADEEQLFGRIDLSSLMPGNPDPEILAKDAEYKRLLLLLEGTDPAEADNLLKELDICRRRLYAQYGNRPRLITDGKIPDSHIVFLDEIFKANDGILNALLTALNERKFTNEGETVDIPTISFFAASNEIPNFNNAEEAILKPLYDRLELKLMTEYVQERDARLAVLKNKQSKNSGAVFSAITLDELCNMQAEVEAVSVSDAINELMDDILCELREKGIHISDRKYFGYYPLAQAYAWLNGKSEVTPQDLLILRHYLWTSPGERTTIKEVLERKCVNPLKDVLDGIRAMALESLKDFEDSAGEDVRRIGKLREEYLTLFQSLSGLRSAAESTEIQQISDTLSELEELSARAHAATTYTYVPLEELLAMRQIA